MYPAMKETRREDRDGKSWLIWYKPQRDEIDTGGMYPQKQDTQNVAESKYGEQVSSMRGYERPVSCHNGKQKKRREGIKPQREERGTKAVYPVKQDTQSIAWRSCGKQVSYMKGYKGHVSYRNWKRYTRKRYPAWQGLCLLSYGAARSVREPPFCCI